MDDNEAKSFTARMGREPKPTDKIEHTVLTVEVGEKTNTPIESLTDGTHFIPVCDGGTNVRLIEVQIKTVQQSKAVDYLDTVKFPVADKVLPSPEGASHGSN